MLKVGLTGGYATGKSLVARELENLGCLVIYADELGHAALEPGGEAYQPALDAFGTGILLPGGSIDRKKLASIVFTSPESLALLNSFVHPAVFRREQEMLAAWNAQHPRGIAVIEAAILIETGRHAAFDRIILTACEQETQIRRGMKRDHLTRDEILARLARQMPLADKQPFAHYLVNTEGGKEETQQRVREVFCELRKLAEGPLA